MNGLINNSIAAPKLALGKIVVSNDADKVLDPAFVLTALSRHCACNWNKAESEVNQYALFWQLRVVSTHLTKTGQEFFIITNSERTQTKVVLAEESSAAVVKLLLLSST